MHARIVAEPSPPEDAPRDAECSENPERRSPSRVSENGCHEKWSDSAAKTGSHKHHTVSGAALAFRKPVRKAARHVGKGSSFSGAEEKSCRQDGDVAPDQAGDHRESGPPENDACQDFPWAQGVAESPARDFKDGIGDGEGAEYPSHLRRVQVQFAGNGSRCGGDTDAIHVSDNRQRKREAQ